MRTCSFNTAGWGETFYSSNQYLSIQFFKAVLLLSRPKVEESGRFVERVFYLRQKKGKTCCCDGVFHYSDSLTNKGPQSHKVAAAVTHIYKPIKRNLTKNDAEYTDLAAKNIYHCKMINVLFSLAVTSLLISSSSSSFEDFFLCMEVPALWPKLESDPDGWCELMTYLCNLSKLMRNLRVCKYVASWKCWLKTWICMEKTQRDKEKHMFLQTGTTLCHMCTLGHVIFWCVGSENRLSIEAHWKIMLKEHPWPSKVTPKGPD